MKGFFDTSVLVPVFYGSHVHHNASLEPFIQFDKSTGCCGAHSLAEVYSTLTFWFDSSSERWWCPRAAKRCGFW